MTCHYIYFLQLFNKLLHLLQFNATISYITLRKANTMSIFTGITDACVDRMLSCFHPVTRDFKAGETIIELSDSLKSICILMKGRAHLYCIDFDGNLQIIENFEKDDVFGELFTLPLGSLEYIIEADTDCSVMFLDYGTVTRPCTSACDHHIELTRNLFLMAAKKSQELVLRISFISRKTVRDKLLTYFGYMADKEQNASFRTHLTLTDLSSYLCVDRTSLMREIKKLNEENIIESSGRRITLKRNLYDQTNNNY